MLRASILLFIASLVALGLGLWGGLVNGEQGQTASSAAIQLGSSLGRSQAGLGFETGRLLFFALLTLAVLAFILALSQDRGWSKNARRRIP